MRLPEFIRRRLVTWALGVRFGRFPDVVIGGHDNPYLMRWYVIPRNRFLNIYLHRFCRSDDDRALHDHPWINCSILLAGRYVEHTILSGGVEVRTTRNAGEIKFRGARSAHRIELTDGNCLTLFITGPRSREWGFHCPAGWKHWKDFTKPGASGEIGPGCE